MTYKQKIADERHEAFEEGREKGGILKLIGIVCRKLAKGKDAAAIAEDLEEDEGTIQAIISAATHCAGGYDPEKIYRKITETAAAAR